MCVNPLAIFDWEHFLGTQSICKQAATPSPPCWHVSILCAVLEEQLSNGMWWAAWVKTTTAKGCRSPCEDTVAWQGQLMSPCAALHEGGLSPFSSLNEKIAWLMLGWSMDTSNLPDCWQTCLYKIKKIILQNKKNKKNLRANPIFFKKVIDFQAQEFLVGLDHCC